MANHAKVVSNRNRKRRGRSFNWGMIFIVLILLYILFNLYMYVSSGHIAEYEVTQGVIATNNTYNGLILRDETVIYADRDGYLNYFVKNATKVAKTDLVYSIDTDGSIAKKINSSTSSSAALQKADLLNLQESVDTFQNAYDNNKFSTVYAFKQNLSTNLNQSLSSHALTILNDTILSAEGRNTFYRHTADGDGVITYYVDGFEDTNTSNFQDEDLLSAGYSRTPLDQQTEIKKGAPVLKRVNNENWNVIISITSQLAKELNETKSLRVRFCKDDFTCPAGCSIIKHEGRYFLNLSLKTGMIRYLNDRYADVELILSNRNGLKIPTSSIVEREFFAIPNEYFNGSGAVYLLVKHSENEEPSMVRPNTYYADENYHYLWTDTVTEGEYLQLADSQQTYVVGTDKVVLDGVYNINKGYAVFKYVNILAENEDYAIVESRRQYSISLYDHIALDGSRISENKTVVK